MSLTIFSELPITKIFTNMSVTPKMLNIFSANISKFTVYKVAWAVAKHTELHVNYTTEHYIRKVILSV